jgi:hypothetical protein
LRQNVFSKRTLGFSRLGGPNKNNMCILYRKCFQHAKIYLAGEGGREGERKEEDAITINDHTDRKCALKKG